VADQAPQAIAARLRQHAPPVIPYITEDQVLLDLRTVPPDQDVALTSALRAISS
jgi:hypothetical protein